MKLFNLDCHISVIADLKQIYESLGHEVTSWSISGHNWVFGRDPSKVDVVNQDNWRNLDKNMCDKFYERYKDELSQYDAFICTYPLSFALLYEKFKKPIILHIPIRYEVPFHNDPSKWEWFNEYLKSGIDNGMIIPVANSVYDKKYFELFTDRECMLIPNMCEYTNTNWKPTINKFLYSGRLPVKFDDNIIVDKSTLGRYKWNDLSSYKSMIIIPYTCSTMSIFEHYAANIPLFFPSKTFMMELYKTYGSYVLSELTWNRIFGTSTSSVIKVDTDNDPNKYGDIDIMSKWIDYSDFYTMPHITYFDSFEDIYTKILSTDLNEVSSKMKECNRNRKESIYNDWKKILDNIK